MLLSNKLKSKQHIKRKNLKTASPRLRLSGPTPNICCCIETRKIFLNSMTN